MSNSLIDPMRERNSRCSIFSRRGMFRVSQNPLEEETGSFVGRAYYDFLEQHAPQADDAPPPTSQPGPQIKKPKAFPVAPLRELAITSCSTKLARLHYQLKNAGLNSRVAFMNRLREKGLGADFLAVMTYEAGDPPYKSRDDLLRFLTHGSPKLRALFSMVNKICYGEKDKLLVVEDVPLNAKFYEDSLRAAWVHVEVLHSKLTHKQRQKLIDDFNDSKSSLQVLVVMNEVSSQGLNLQRASSNTVTMIPGKRIGPQIQTENRILRVDQTKACFIHRLHLDNSHDPWREARQTSNVRLEIATKSHLPAMRCELVLVLNEAQDDLRALKETPRAKELMDVPDVEIPRDSGDDEDDEPEGDFEEAKEIGIGSTGQVPESPQFTRSDDDDDTSSTKDEEDIATGALGQVPDRPLRPLETEEKRDPDDELENASAPIEYPPLFEETDKDGENSDEHSGNPEQDGENLDENGETPYDAGDFWLYSDSELDERIAAAELEEEKSADKRIAAAE